ncbi:MAG TPA: DNA polymerase III subunit gamma/tau C-terminal domain-containing protein [Burkholderiales bacterium]
MLAFRPDGPGIAVAEKKEVKKNESQGKAAFDGDWPALVQRLPLSGGPKELARNSELKSRDGAVFGLVLQKSMAHLAGDAFREKLQAALTAHFGSPAKVQVTLGETGGVTAAAREAGDRSARQAEASRAVKGDSFVQDLVNLFDGRVVDSTIREKQR